MKTIRLIIALTVSAFAGTFTFAQTTPVSLPPSGAPVEFLVAAGSSSGTYKKFLEQMSAVTSDIITFKLADSSGSVENLDLLINNSVMGAFMHSDVLFFRAQTTDMSRFKTLIALYSEEVHFLALNTPKRTIGGTLGYGKTVVTVNSLDDLKAGVRVGAAGGGAITAQTIRLQAQLPFDFVPFTSGTALMAALEAGEIDVAIYVGGAPLPNIEKLGPAYKLIPVGDRTATMLKSVYKTASLTYPRMRPEAVPTLAADALFIAREYRTPRFVNALRTFRDTFYSRLDELKEVPGNHRKWNEVSSDAKGKWPYMEFAPTTSAAK